MRRPFLSACDCARFRRGLLAEAMVISSGLATPKVVLYCMGVGIMIVLPLVMLAHAHLEQATPHPDCSGVRTSIPILARTMNPDAEHVVTVNPERLLIHTFRGNATPARPIAWQASRTVSIVEV